MSVKIIKGQDIFGSPLSTIAITVNLVKTMGKGIALQAKELYPFIDIEYKIACDTGALDIGTPFYLDTRRSKHNFLLVPTKRHWRNNSRIEDIKSCLEWLQVYYKSYGIKSIAFPPLGCGNGNLDWSVIKPLMISYLQNLDMEIEIYEEN